MSEDSSHISKDPTKGPKKKNSGHNSDFKQPRKGSKDYQVYFEAKGSEKPPKDHSNAQKAGFSSTNPDEQHGHKNHRNDSNKQRSHAKNRKESRDQTHNIPKKKYSQVSKEVIIEFYLRAPSHKDIDDFVANCSQLFVKEKQIPVNKEDNQLDSSEGLILKTYPPASHAPTHAHAHGHTHSAHVAAASTNDVTPAPTTANNTTTTGPATSAPNTSTQTAPTVVVAKPIESAEAPVNLNDPIQAMREKMKRDKLNKEKKELEARAAKEAENKSKEESIKKESAQEADLDDKEKENKNSSNQSEAYKHTTNQMQKESAKEEKPTVTLENLSPSKTQKVELDGQRSQTEKPDGNRSPTRDSGVDFSKLSFDTENKSDELNPQQGDVYGSASGRNAQQKMYQDLAANPNYNPSEANQANIYRGGSAQHIQQVNTQYPNTPSMQEQASPSRLTGPGSLTNIPKQTTPPGIVFKYFSPNYEDKVWSYIDLEGNLQGPFSGRTMDDWYSKGYLPTELDVTIGKGNGFKNLQDLIEIIVSHNTQGAKTPTPPKTSSPQDNQYQQQQQYYQQQQQQHQQQQQQQRQYQQHQQYQQQPQYQQQQYQQQNQYTQQQRSYQQQDLKSYPDYNQFGSTTPTTSANRNRAMEGYENNMYYGNQGGNQYVPQNNVIYGKVTEIADPHANSGTYYSNVQYYNQEQPQKSPANVGYGGYKQGATPTSSGYYQDPNSFSSSYNQQSYNQPQKQVQKTNYPSQMQNYSGSNQMGSYGGNFGTQGMNAQANPRDYSNYGGNAGNAQMYSMQQQPQMMNRTPSMGSGNMGMNSNMPNDVAMQLKNMLGMSRPSSSQTGAEY